ncbi:MAG: fibronectin type III domain-containing protein, partial [Burkholderiales bacterium]|nr:fibronectin type III domain-containing protein [Opitutaceae bacterium]
IETPLTPELAITPNFLPAPLQSLDLGKVGLNGGASASTTGTYTLTGSGSGLGAEFDSCHFAYFTAPLTGDFTLSARVATLGTTGSFPEAGLMLRSSLADTAPYARIYTSSVYTSYQFRNPANGNIGYSAGDKTKRWVRLVRTANSCTGWISADGVTWTQQGGSVTLSGPVHVGLHVSSLNNSVLHTSTFDNLTLTPAVPLQAPATPLNLSLVPASSTSVTLAWSAASGASAYHVKRATTPGGPYTTVATGLNALNTTVSGLTPATPYYFTVSALNSAGESPDATAVSVNTLAAPTNLTATARSETQLRLDWQNSAPAATALELQRSPAAANLWTTLTATLPPTATTYTDATLQPSTAYDFRLRALDATSASPFVTLANTPTPSGIGDGIPGAWRLQYFGDGLTLTAASAPAADPDGDGLDNLDEYLAGTLPTDPASTLRLLGPTRSGDDYLLTFASVPGKTYRVEKTSTLAPPAWIPVQSPFAGTGGTLTATDTDGATAPTIFYRLTVN